MSQQKKTSRCLNYKNASASDRQAWLEQNIDQIAWEKQNSLLAAIVQDVQTRQVLMLGYMNLDALKASVNQGKVHFYSRSRQRLWLKGETSGNFLAIQHLALDCDSDSLLVLARPVGPTCHLGTSSCFESNLTEPAENIASLGVGWLGRLEQIITNRRNQNDGKPSYVQHLFAKGLARMAQKVGEEGVEVALAAMKMELAKNSNDSLVLNEAKNELAAEAADLLFHLLVVLQAQGLDLQAAIAVLEERHSLNNPAQ